MNVKYRNNKLAVAVAGALAASPIAVAHADVSFYGIADVSVSSLDYGQTGSKLFLTQGSGSGGSRFGVNASQDVGDGLKVKANFEGGVNLNTPYATLFTLRQGWVGLSGGFGTVNAGTDYNLTDFVIYDGEACGWCGVASIASLTSDDVRDANYLKYMSPNMGGFSFGLGHVFGQDATTSGDSDRNEAAVFYSGGPLKVDASYRTTNLAGASSGQKVNDYYLTGSLAFGIAKVYVLFGNQKGASGNTTDRQFTNLGVSFKLGGGDLNLQSGQRKDKAVSNSNSTLTAVSYYRAIAKGTTAYAQYGTVKNDSAANQAPFIFVSPAPTQATGKDFSGVQVGVKYAF